MVLNTDKWDVYFFACGLFLISTIIFYLLVFKKEKEHYIEGLASTFISLALSFGLCAMIIRFLSGNSWALLVSIVCGVFGFSLIVVLTLGSELFLLFTGKNLENPHKSRRKIVEDY